MARRTAAYERTVEQAERDAEIARYKIGRRYIDVTERFGISLSTAHAAVKRAIQAAAAPAGQEVIAEELLKLEAMEQAAWDVLRANHVHVADGRVVKDDGERITDHKPVLMAIDRLLRCAERKARLMGLDAPDRTEVTVFTADATERAIAELEAQLAENDPQAGSSRPA